MEILIQLTEKEWKIAASYAQMHSLSLDVAFKQALFERIEDEYDLSVADEAYNNYLESGYKSTPIADFWRDLDTEE